MSWWRNSGTDKLGYHAVNVGQMNVDALARRPRGAPDHGELPILFLGQVAVSTGHQGRGLGSILMHHVFLKAVRPTPCRSGGIGMPRPRSRRHGRQLEGGLRAAAAMVCGVRVLSVCQQPGADVHDDQADTSFNSRLKLDHSSSVEGNPFTRLMICRHDV